MKPCPFFVASTLLGFSFLITPPLQAELGHITHVDPVEVPDTGDSLLGNEGGTQHTIVNNSDGTTTEHIENADGTSTTAYDNGDRVDSDSTYTERDASGNATQSDRYTSTAGYDEHVRTEYGDDGTTTTTEMNSNGDPIRTTTTHGGRSDPTHVDPVPVPDSGENVLAEEVEQGDTYTIIRNPDGTTIEHVQRPDGSSTTARHQSDGIDSDTVYTDRDASGNVTSTEHHNSTAGFDTFTRTTYGEDGRTITTSLDPNEQPRRTTTTYPDGTIDTIDYGPDGEARFQRTTFPNGGEFTWERRPDGTVITKDYDENGRLYRRTQLNPDGTTDRQEDFGDGIGISDGPGVDTTGIQGFESPDHIDALAAHHPVE